MRKMIGIILVVLMLPVTALAVDWMVTDHCTLSWDAIPDLGYNATIEYIPCFCNAVTDPDKENPMMIGSTPDLSCTVTFYSEGQYFLGVKAVTILDGQELAASEINWSDDPVGNLSGEAFGVWYYTCPPPPVNMGISQ